MSELNKEESKLLVLYRAIKSFDKQHLVSNADVGDVLKALDSVNEVEELTDEYAAGFIAGIAAIQLAQTEVVEVSPADFDRPEYPPNAPSPEEEAETRFIGGPTGGVAEEQGVNPDYVTQSGVHEGQNDSVK